MSSNQPIDQAVTGLRHDLDALRGEVAQRFDTADRQFTYVDHRFDDAVQRLAGAEQRGALALDRLADGLSTTLHRTSRRHLTVLVGSQLAHLVVVTLLVVAW